MEQQPQPYNSPSPDEYDVMPPFNRGESEGTEIGIIRELSPKKMLEQLRMNLKGFFWDYEKRDWVKIEGFEPLLNDKGIAKYLSIMSSVVTDLVTFSNYKDNEIAQLTLYICDKAIPTIHINYKDYDIREKSDLQIVDIQIFNLTYAAFKKAVAAGDRGVIGRTISEAIMTRAGGQSIQQQERKSFLSRINPFSRS